MLFSAPDRIFGGWARSIHGEYAWLFVPIPFDTWQGILVAPRTSRSWALCGSWRDISQHLENYEKVGPLGYAPEPYASFLPLPT